MTRHRQKQLSPVLAWIKKWPVLIAVVLIALLASSSWWLFLRGSDADRAANVAGGGGNVCAEPASTPVRIWVPAALTKAVTEVASRLTECGEYDVRTIESAQGLSELTARSTAVPDAWITDGIMWEDALRNNGTQVNVSRVMATSPIVLTAPKAFGAKALAGSKLQADASWSEILSASNLSVSMGDPLQDPASLLALITAEDFIDSDSAWQTFLAEAAQDVIVGSPIQAILEDKANVFAPTSEQDLWAAEGGKDLQIVAPAEGAGLLSYRLLTMGQNQANETAVTALDEALRGEGGMKVFSENGLRPGAEGPSPGVDGVPPVLPRVALIGPDELDALITNWNTFVLPVQILALTDVSGSMDLIVNDTNETRIEITKKASVAAVKALAPRSRFGVRWFSTLRGPDGQDWVEGEPIKTLNEDAGNGKTHLDKVITAIEAVDEDFTTGDTGLYDSIADAYRDLIAQNDPGFRSSLVVMTDGINDDTGGGLDLDELLKELDALRDADRPTGVVLLGIGPDVDAGPMQQIAEATGGRYFSVENPEAVGDVLQQLITERSG